MPTFITSACSRNETRSLTHENRILIESRVVFIYRLYVVWSTNQDTPVVRRGNANNTKCACEGTFSVYVLLPGTPGLWCCSCALWRRWWSCPAGLSAALYPSLRCSSKRQNRAGIKGQRVQTSAAELLLAHNKTHNTTKLISDLPIGLIRPYWVCGCWSFSQQMEENVINGLFF